MCSLEHDQTINIGCKRRHHVLDIPPGVSVEDAMKIYNTAWGHSLANSMHFLTQCIGLMEIDSELKDAYVSYMEKQRKKRSVHLVKKEENEVKPTYKNIGGISDDDAFHRGQHGMRDLF